MPKANWSISASDVDDFDRSTQYTPYMGPTPPSNVVYMWTVKNLKYVAATDDTLPQLRVGLELHPRDTKERKFKGFYQVAFLHIADSTRWKYVPFLDALGVSGRDFANRTILDQDNNIQKIGQWRNDGKQLVAAQLLENDPDFAHKNPHKIGWIGEAPEDFTGDDDESDVEDEYEEDEEEETPKPQRGSARRAQKTRRGASSTRSGARRRRSTRNDDEDYE